MKIDINQYRNYRLVGKNLNTELFRELDGANLKCSARHLGILKKDKIVLERDEEMDLFADYSINDFQDKNGKNAVQLYLEKNIDNIDETEKELIQALLKSNSSLFEVKETNPTLSKVYLSDVFNGRSDIEIIDIGFSSSLISKKLLIFTRILELKNMNITSGAAMVFEKKDETVILKKYNQLVKKVTIKKEKAKMYIAFFKLNRQFGYEVRFKDVRA